MALRWGGEDYKMKWTFRLEAAASVNSPYFGGSEEALTLPSERA
jgi:hypothetical protein